MIVAVTGEVPVFVAVNAGVLPEPLAARPMLVVEFVHVNVVPGTGLVNATDGTPAVLQYAMFATLVTVGVGLTVIVNWIDDPTHVAPALEYEGVTVIVAVIGAVVVLVATKAGIVFVPLAAMPIAVVDELH